MFCWFVADNDAAEVDISHGARYKPEGIDELCKNTAFSKKELQIMYRGFKQVPQSYKYRVHTGIAFIQVPRS